MSSKRSFRRTFLCGAAIGALSLSGTAIAQDADTTDAEDVIEVIEESETEARQEKITVTGSLLQRSEFSSAAPIQVITADSASLEGLIDSAAILQGSSIAAGSTQINNQFQGFVVDGGTGVNTVDLRGCGTTRTLVLINGKRPGPSGTRGAVGAFDFNVIPGSIVQRYEILKDSGSTIYGSDAVCGVVNVITKTSVDKPEITLDLTKPFDSGGESYGISGAYGFNFDTGSIALSASYTLNEDLSVGDRDYLDCDQDLVNNSATGESFDRVNRSVTANGSTGRRNCGNIYFNTVIDRVTGDRFVPSPDGREIGGTFGGVIPGYRPRENGTIPNSGGRAFYEDVLESPLYLTEDAINKRELLSGYAVADFDLGFANSVTELLYTNRQTTAEGWRQFFPDIRGTGVFGGFFAYPNDPGYANPINSVILPVYMWPSNAEIDANYTMLQTSLTGNIGNDWGWALGANYSISDADYTRNQIRATISGDWAVGNGDAPTYDVIDTDILAGGTPAWQALVNQLTGIDTGNTEYTQYLINGSIAGDIFEMPAGAVAAAVGFEYRDFEINDVPGEFTQSGDVWSSSTSGITAGSDNVAEIFAEVEVPLLKGQKFAESLSLNASARAFDYDSTGTGDVYKLGMDWQINPSLRVRATKGTSFRAPALFEQYLDRQTSFIGQFGLDICEDFVGSTRSTNTRVDTNCLADGIPAGFTNLGSSALVIAGGNGDTLQPETSDSFTAGIIFTPSFADFNMAVDYFEIEVNDQIAQLGAGSIVAACYNSDPAQFANNAFCDLFDRAPSNDPQAPFAIDNIVNQFLNINSQVQRGIDLEVRYEREFNFGTMSVDADATWTLESLTSLFAPGEVDGIDDNDFNGTIGDPGLVASTRVGLDRGDWTYTWFSRYVGNTSNARFADTPDGFGENYFGALVDVNYDLEAVIYHGLSARWNGDTWAVTGGIDNLFDEHPSTASAEAAAARDHFTRGNTQLFATQYDLRGRKAFVRVSKTF